METTNGPEENQLGKFISKLNREDIPIFSRTVKEFIDISNKKDSPLSDLSLVILRDPSLTAKVLKMANSVIYSLDTRKTATVSRAVFQLGFKTIQRMCITSLLIEKFTSGSQKERVIAEMVNSFHAAVQARSLAVARGDPSVEEIFVATLLFRIGHIAFWSLGGESVELLSEALKKRPNEPQKRVEKDVLGYSLKDLTHALVKEWGLGELLETSLAEIESDKRITNVLLGHTLAEGIDRGWKSAEMEEAVSDTSKFLKRSHDEVAKLVKETTLSAIQSARDYGIDNFIKYIPVESEPIQDTQVEEYSPAPQFDVMVQLEILSELNSLIRGDEFNLNLYMITLIEGISRGIGLRRVLFSIVSPDKKYLMGRFGIGWQQTEIEQFRISIKPSFPNVFSEMIHEIAPVWVNSNKAKMREYITDEVRIRMGTQHFFTAPIMVKGSVIGVICGDCGKNYEELSPKKFTCFEFMINTSNDVLSVLL